VLDVEVVADEEEEGLALREIASAQHGMAVAARRLLGDEMEPAGQVARSQAIGGFIAGPDDEADLVDAGPRTSSARMRRAVFSRPSRSMRVWSGSVAWARPAAVMMAF
jgi:hypothetical protein